MVKTKPHDLGSLEAAMASLATPAKPVGTPPPVLMSDIGVTEPDAEEAHQQLVEEVGDSVDLDGTIAEIAAGAVTAADFLRVLKRITIDAEKNDAVLAQLEAERGSVILSGVDIEDFHRRLFVAKQTKVSLKAAEEEIQRRYVDAVGVEQVTALEAEAAAVRGESVPGYRAGLARFHAAMQELIEAAKEVDLHEAAITEMNDHAGRLSRSDLIVRLLLERRQVIEELAGPLPSMVAVERRDGESEEAFIIRQGNAQNEMLAAQRRHDPFQIAGNAAASAIEELAFDMDPFERAKNRRLVSVKTYRGYDGQPVREIKDVLVDGRSPTGAPLKPQFGPYGKHGVRKTNATDRGILRGAGHDAA